MMTPKTLSTPEKNLYYQVNQFILGRETLVLLHGVFGHVGYWSEYEKYYEQRYNVVSLDLRGMGKSFRPKRYRDYDLANSVQDLKDVLDAEGITKIILVSASLSDFIAVRFTAQYPSVVHKLILFSFSGRPGTAVSTVFFRALFWVISLFNYFPVRTGNHYVIEDIRATYDWHWRRLYIDITNTGLRSTFHLLRAFYHFDIAGDIPEISVPVLLVHGEKDTILPYRWVLKDFPKFQNAVLDTIPEGDHMICQTHLEVALRSMDKFLSA